MVRKVVSMVIYARVEGYDHWPISMVFLGTLLWLIIIYTTQKQFLYAPALAVMEHTWLDEHHCNVFD